LKKPIDEYRKDVSVRPAADKFGVPKSTLHEHTVYLPCLANVGINSVLTARGEKSSFSFSECVKERFAAFLLFSISVSFFALFLSPFYHSFFLRFSIFLPLWFQCFLLSISSVFRFSFFSFKCAIFLISVVTRMYVASGFSRNNAKTVATRREIHFNRMKWSAMWGSFSIGCHGFSWISADLLFALAV
jgi:hypothetical protein